MGNKKRSLSKKRQRTGKAHARNLDARKKMRDSIIKDVINDLLQNVENSKESTTCCRMLINDIIAKLPSPEHSSMNISQRFEFPEPSTSKSHLSFEPKPSTSGITTLATENKNEKDEYDFTWGSSKEYERINKEPLEIEKVVEDTTLTGFRIIEINYFIKTIMALQKTHSQICTGGHFRYCREDRIGLISEFTYKCNSCDKNVSFRTEKPRPKPLLNKAAVWGILSIGSTYAHMSEFLSILNIPHMPGNMFFDIQRSLGPIWKESLWQIMQDAAIEEHRIASEQGNIDGNGVAEITVLLDGGWSKRSYGHSYNAASGVAVIIGKQTGKLLYLGVRNKFCIICAKSENKNQPPPNHVCFKNWTGASGSMEPDIVVEGFNCSIEMYKLKYTKFIADGDSTVFSKIRENVSYGREVVKIECTNHAIKNFSKHLYNIKKNTKGVSLSARKFLTKMKIDELAKTAQNVIYANAHGDLQTLRSDMANIINHTFQNHANCKEYVCKKVGNVTDNEMAKLKESGGYHHIFGALNMLLSKAHLLIDNETNNRAELFMSILARFNMGKRLNLITRDSFQTRSYLTGLRYNEGQLWHSKAWKKVFEESPGKNLKQYMAVQTLRAKKRKAGVIKKRVVKRLKLSPKAQPNYKPDIAAIEMSSEELDNAVTSLLDGMTITLEEQQNIAKNTIGQFNNPVYLCNRMNRLTASKFGNVMRRKPNTACEVLVRSILYPSNFTSPAMEYGKRNEIVAIKKFEDKTGYEVTSSGLYIDVQNGFLGASPDGLINDEAIVEVKCLYKVATLKITLEEAVKQKKVMCLGFQNGSLHLKKNHDYYYQIQGQLAITNVEQCFFVVYTGDSNDLFIEVIERDRQLWSEKMLPKLKTFYTQCIAPEIILQNIKRGVKCDKH